MSLVKHKRPKPAKAWTYDPEVKQRATQVVTLQRDNDIIALILEGRSNNDVKDFICKKYNLQRNTATVYVNRAHAKIKERKAWELDALIDIHLQRYEEIYHKLFELGAKGSAIVALQSKEKLLGLHKNGTHFRVNNQELTTISLQDVTADYDFSKLSDSEQGRATELLNKLSVKG